MQDASRGYVPMRATEPEQPEEEEEEGPKVSNRRRVTKLHTEQLIDAVNLIARSKDFLPRPNIYRCFALGFPATMTDHFLITACMAVQILGALIVYDYSHRIGQEYCYENIYTHLANLTETMAKESNRENDGLAFLVNCFYFDDVRKIIEMKLLGGVLLCMVFATLGRNLTGQAADVEYLMMFFCINKARQVKWLLVDVVCNSLCYLIIGLTVGTFLAFEDTVVDILLDSVGLFFLANVDSLSSDIAYSMTNDHFMKVVTLAHEKWLSRYNPNTIDTYTPLEGNYVPDEIQPYSPRDSHSSCMVHVSRALTASARFLNQIIVCVQLILFLHTSRADASEGCKKVGFHQALIDQQFSLWPAFSLWTALVAYETLHHYNMQKKRNDGQLDGLFQIFFQVLVPKNNYRVLYQRALTKDISEAELHAIENTGKENELEERLLNLEEWRDSLEGSSKAGQKPNVRGSCAAAMFSKFGR